MVGRSWAGRCSRWRLAAEVEQVLAIVLGGTAGIWGGGEVGGVVVVVGDLKRHDAGGGGCGLDSRKVGGRGLLVINVGRLISNYVSAQVFCEGCAVTLVAHWEVDRL